MENKIKAIIFDMDGVLVDAKKWHYFALNKALKEYELEITEIEHKEIYDGLTTRQKLKLLTKNKGLDPNLIEEIFLLKQKYTTEAIENNCTEYQPHVEMLEKLYQKYTLALASNSTKNSVNLLMSKSNLIGYFDFCLSNEDVSNPKPDPEIYNTAISRLALKPHECLVLEDNKNGIKAAQASGAHVLEIKNFEAVSYELIIDTIKKIEEDHD